MDENVALTPLLRWDGLHLVLNLKMVESFLRRRLGHLRWLEGLELSGRGDAIGVRASLEWKGLRAPAEVELAELRLRHRRLGFRLRHPRAPGRLRIPRRAVEMAVDALDTELVTVVRGHGIVVVDLRRWIPPELVLSVRTVQATSSYLHVWLGPGVVHDLPGATPLLESGS